MSTAFVHRRRVGFADTDMAGIIFYPRYFEMVQETVEAWFEQGLNYPYSQMNTEDGCGIPLVSIQADFLRPSRLEDHLDIHLRLVALGGSSFTLKQRLLCHGEERVAVTMKCAYARIDPIGAQPIPDWLRQRMEPYLRA